MRKLFSVILVGLCAFANIASADGIDSYTKLMLHCDGADGSTTITDSSYSAHTVTAVNDAQIDTAQSVFGGASLLLDGTDYITVPDSDDWSWGSGDWTIDFRVRFNSESAYDTFFSQWPGAGNYGILLAQDATTNTVYLFASSNGTAYTTCSAPWNPTTGTWYHFAVVRTGDVVKFFVNGAQIGTNQTLTGSLFNSTATLNIGRIEVGNQHYFDGWIDEFRVSKGIARWTSNFTPPTSAYSEVSATSRRSVIVI